MFRARVELLGMVCILALTEDRSVTKRILQVGSSRRQLGRRGLVVVEDDSVFSVVSVSRVS